jgi:hypothetical protein
MISSFRIRMTTLTMTKTEPPEWLLAFWKEIDDKTFGAGFDCFVKDATCRLGVAEWNGREQIRQSLRATIDTGFTAHHDVTEYWDGGSIKVFRGIVTIKRDDRSKPTVKPVMTHFFLHGRDRSFESPQLDRMGRPGRVLIRCTFAKGQAMHDSRAANRACGAGFHPAADSQSAHEQAD